MKVMTFSPSDNTPNIRAFNRLATIALVTLISVYAVILAGSTVRASGAGMGCPDWPKCFGKWVPPTDVSQLPANYKEIYAGEHNAVEEFSALNTWTEYVNRLVGALCGLFIFAQLLMAWPVRKADRLLFSLSFLEFLAIGFQGCLGAKVVSSALAPYKITTHMLMSLVIVGLGIIIVFRARNHAGRRESVEVLPASFRWTIFGLLILTIFQTLSGTQVRESVDHLLDQVTRAMVIPQLGVAFDVHRLLGALSLFANGWLAHQIYSELKGRNRPLRFHARLIMGCLLLSIATGLTMNRLDLPAMAQPAHLMLGCILFGSQFMVLLYAFRKT